MAETSGFFQAQWDENLQNPETGEWTGWWDRDYMAQQFADYFKLFIGNGVFGSPTNQLKVVPGTGLTVIVKAGWAFINGFWYHNDTDLIIPISANGGSAARIDSIRLRWTNANRTIVALAFDGDINNVRTNAIYDLKLANVSVPVGALEIDAADITDTRTNESVCGLVKGVLEVETTEDLFAQYNAAFTSWFNSIKGQLDGDLGVRLQLEFAQLNQNVETYYSNTSSQVSAAASLVEDYVYNDYVIQESDLTFVNKVCEISDNKVTANSLIDVYFTAETMPYAEDAVITADSTTGKIVLTAEKQPAQTLRARIRVRVNG